MPLRLPWKRSGDAAADAYKADEDDAEATILANLWKQQRLLPPTSKYRSYWDLVRARTLLAYAPQPQPLIVRLVRARVHR